jgi:hypothetical protein
MLEILLALFLAAFIEFFMIMMGWPVLQPYLAAQFSGKRVCLVCDAFNGATIESVKFDGKSILLNNPVYRFIKKGNNGSYRLGNCQMEAIYKETVLAAEAPFMAALETAKAAGFTDYTDVTLFLMECINNNNKRLGKEAVFVNYDVNQRISEILTFYPEFNIEMLYPLVGKIDLKSMATMVDTIPQELTNIIKQSEAMIAKKYADGAKIEKKSLGGMIPILMIGFVIMIIIGAAMMAMGLI